MMKILKTCLPSVPILLAVGTVLPATPLFGQNIAVDTASARAVLQALRNPDLTYNQAMAVAKLEGNQGMIHEMQDLGEADSRRSSAS